MYVEVNIGYSGGSKPKRKYLLYTILLHNTISVYQIIRLFFTKNIAFRIDPYQIIAAEEEECDSVLAQRENS